MNGWIPKRDATPLNPENLIKWSKATGSPVICPSRVITPLSAPFLVNSASSSSLGIGDLKSNEKKKKKKKKINAPRSLFPFVSPLLIRSPANSDFPLFFSNRDTLPLSYIHIYTFDLIFHPRIETTYLSASTYALLPILSFPFITLPLPTTLFHLRQSTAATRTKGGYYN